VSDPDPSRRAAIIVNPTKVADLEVLRTGLTAGMNQAGWAAPLWLETSVDDPGYGMTQHALRDNVDLVLACGGDGTVRAILTELAGSGTPLGVIPLGTGNLLARNLGLPLGDVDAALRIALTGVDRPIDVGRVEPVTPGGRHERFAVMAGVGFDAAMMRDAPKKLKARLGWPAYVVSGVQHLRGSSMRVQLRIDGGEPVHARVRTVVVGNVPKLLAGLELLPDAEPDDGVLDVAVIVSHSVMDWARVASRIITRHGYVDHRYTTYHGKKIQITAGSPQPRQIDGDLIADSRQLTVQIEDAALVVRVPAIEARHIS
jgi:Sphingosine kinase and enzymes related to eukaryotic diacylglycerol kinase